MQFYNIILNVFDCQTKPCLPKYLPISSKDITYTYKKKPISITDPTRWPVANEFGLNDDQLLALKTALGSRFSIIQGPPGTGKTFIGLEILKTLLSNSQQQVLVITLTNHALDQFLLGSLPFTDDIVRVGSQSRCERLNGFNLKGLTEGAVANGDKRIKNCYWLLKCEYNQLYERFMQLQTAAPPASIEEEKAKIGEKELLQIHVSTIYKVVPTSMSNYLQKFIF